MMEPTINYICRQSVRVLPFFKKTLDLISTFYLWGVNIGYSDKFESKYHIDGCKQRDEFVFSLLKSKNIPW